MEYAVLINSSADFDTGCRLAESLGNCAIFVRKLDGTAPLDVWIARQLFIVGGGSVGHSNEVIYKP